MFLRSEQFSRKQMCFLKFWWHHATLLFIHTIQSYILSSFIICRGQSSCIFIFYPLTQHEKPPRGAKPRVEPGPALQQADALPAELRRTLFYQDLIWRGVQVHSDDFKKLNEFAESAWVCRDPGNADSIKETRRRLLAQVRLDKCVP